MPSEPCGLVKLIVLNEKYRRNTRTQSWMWFLPIALLNHIIAAEATGIRRGCIWIVGHAMARTEKKIWNWTDTFLRKIEPSSSIWWHLYNWFRLVSSPPLPFSWYGTISVSIRAMRPAHPNLNWTAWTILVKYKINLTGFYFKDHEYNFLGV